MHAFDSYSAADQALLEAVQAGDLAGVKAAVDAGGNPWKEERHVLWEAVSAGQTAVVAHLLAEVAHLPRYANLLSACVQSPSCDISMFVLLLSKSEEGDVQEALVTAVSHHRNHLVPTLLARLPEPLPVLPLTMAAEAGNEEMVRLLLPRCPSANRDSEAIRRAARGGYLGIVDLLIPHSPAHALHDAWEAACQGNHLAVVDRLLPSIAQDRRQQGLQAAAEAGANAVVERLLPLTEPAMNRSKALRLAAGRGRLDTVALLLPHCPDPQDQVSSFYAARDEDHDGVADYLVRWMPVEAGDYAGVNWAHRSGHDRLFEDLMAKVDPEAFHAWVRDDLEGPDVHPTDREISRTLLDHAGMVLPPEAVAGWVAQHGEALLPNTAGRLRSTARASVLQDRPAALPARSRRRS